MTNQWKQVGNKKPRWTYFDGTIKIVVENTTIGEYYYQVYSISEGRYKLTNSDILLDSNEKPVLKQLQEKFSPSF